nr:hypothetical protein CFP56_43798 [Quercus suber]
MNALEDEFHIQPAQLAFLAIYNPTLGPTDESFPEQLVFYYSRTAAKGRRDPKRRRTNDQQTDELLRAEENEKLRQIGLAQGMVNFARCASLTDSSSALTAEKSIDLTRIPIAEPAVTVVPTKGTVNSKPKAEYEYSSREVSPPLLMIQQLVQAHHVFLLHHGPSLDELFVRLKRHKFCATLDRYWSRVARTWNVLLHDNPAIDAFDAVKVNSGGELGFGVGEEDWGSGERNVLEDLVRRTEGMVDLVVSRFGDSVPKPPEVGKNLDVEAETVPWMGSGKAPNCMDGIVFSGIGAITRPSLRSLSLWMRQIYSYGEHAYGVHDNPSRERLRRRRVVTSVDPSATKDSTLSRRDSKDDNATHRSVKGQRRLSSARAAASSGSSSSAITSEQRLRTQENIATRDRIAGPKRNLTSASQSTIPRPIVSAAEQALNEATRKADEGAQSQRDRTRNQDSSTTMGIPDTYMKYLTFGLSTLTKPVVPKQPTASASTSAASALSQKLALKPTSLHDDDSDHLDADEPTMTQMDPLPDGALAMAKSVVQQNLESHGHFVIGLKGNLKRQEGYMEDDNGASEADNDDGARKVIRTLCIEVNSANVEDNANDNDAGISQELKDRLPTGKAGHDSQRLRALVYVHRPFVYCLLFESQTTSLRYSKLYQDIHHSLLPIHKSLIASTSAVRVSQLVDASQPKHDDSTSLRSVAQSSTSSESNTTDIYDLLYDPRTLSLHTSIPNIPDPGTPAAEGFVAGRARDFQHIWTRVDAMNVHNQILSTLASTQWHENEVERSSKTSRGWWVAWLRLPFETTDATDTSSAAPTASTAQSEDPSDATVPVPSTMAPAETQLHRVAFLVRKAAEPKQDVNASVGSRAMAGLFGALSLRNSSTTQDRTGGARVGWGPGALTGGIGVDARKYVEGLFSLNR